MEPTTCYRIYTEDVTIRSELTDVVRRYFESFTLLRGTGYYKQIGEPCLLIEILADAAALQSVINLAGDIRVLFNQSEVLVTEHPVRGYLIVDQTT